MPVTVEGSCIRIGDADGMPVGAERSAAYRREVDVGSELGACRRFGIVVDIRVPERDEVRRGTNQIRVGGCARTRPCQRLIDHAAHGGEGVYKSSFPSFLFYVNILISFVFTSQIGNFSN